MMLFKYEQLDAEINSVEYSSSSRKTKIEYYLHFQELIVKEHVQLRFGVEKSPYFENSGPNWSKLGSFLDKHHISHVIDLIFG